MRFSDSLLLSAVAGAANAATQSPAAAFVFPQSKLSESSSVPTLSPQDARLVFAQRLGASQFHDITSASDETLEFINTFGGHPQDLALSRVEERFQLVVIVDGVTDDYTEKLAAASDTFSQPAFKISSPPSPSANAQLVKDLIAQNPVVDGEGCDMSKGVYSLENDECWQSSARLVHLNAAKDIAALQDLITVLPKIGASSGLDALLVLMPASASTAKSSSMPYGSYEKALKSQYARRQEEAPLTETFPEVTAEGVKVSYKTNSSAAAPRVPLPVCYPKLEDCQATTGNCSGHGACFKKYSSSEGDCFACGCVPTVEQRGEGIKTIHWGGSTCAKKDVSGPFWLIAIFTVTLVGLISWSIGLLFSVGNEKLPGVIGAGVSGPKGR